MTNITHRELVERFFDRPDNYIRNNPYVQLRSKSVGRMLIGRPKSSILDLGCGDGRVSLPLVASGGELLLVDSSHTMLELALLNTPEHISARVRRQRADVSEWRSVERFDVVLCIGLLAHVPNALRMLQVVSECVNSKGCAVIQYTDGAAFLGRVTHRMSELRRRYINASAHEMNHMTHAQVHAEMSRRGFTLRTSSRYAILPGIRRLPASVALAAARFGARDPLARAGGEVLALYSR